MDKTILLEKLKEEKKTKEINIDRIISWVTCLPSSTVNRKPIRYRVGDVFMHPIFQHPYILLEKKDNVWVCGLLTSESKCPEILEKTKSRFFPNSYITKTLFTASEIQGSFLNMYNNAKHLKEVRIKLKSIFA